MRIDDELQSLTVRLVCIGDPSLYLDVEVDLSDEGGDSMGGTALQAVCPTCAAELELWAEQVTATYAPPAPDGWRIEDAPASVQ